MNNQKTLFSRAWAELLLLAGIWGGSFLSIRVALDEIGFLTSVAHRVGWAALVLWGVVLLSRLPVPRALRVWGAFLVMGLLNNVIPFSLMAWGQLHIETGLTSILNASTAVFGVLVAAIVFRDERLTVRRGIGVVLGFFGVATAIGLDALRSFDLRSLAQLAVLGGTLSYALAGSWARATMSGLSPQVAAAGMLTGSALVMVPVAVWLEGPPRFDLEPRTWAAIGYYAVAAGLSGICAAGNGVGDPGRAVGATAVQKLSHVQRQVLACPSPNGDGCLRRAILKPKESGWILVVGSG